MVEQRHYDVREAIVKSSQGGSLADTLSLTPYFGLSASQ